MSMELFPSSQGHGKTVLILTGSNKRDHLLGYFIISLFICMWALQEASNLPPDANGWREATAVARFLAQVPGTWWILCRSGAELQWSLWVPLRAVSVILWSAPECAPMSSPWAALQADVTYTHHYEQKCGQKGNRWGKKSAKWALKRGGTGAMVLLAICYLQLQRWKEPSSDSNCSNQSKSHLTICLHDIFLPVHENRNEFSGCIWRWWFHRFYRRINYTFQLSVLEKEIVWRRELQSSLWDFEEGCGEHKSEQKWTPCTLDWWNP